MTSPQTQQLYDDALVWDAHVCFPLNPKAELDELQRYRASGVSFVSINIGMDMDAFDKIVQVLAGFRHYIQSCPDEYILARTVHDLRTAKAAGKLAVAFDLEGSDPLLGNVNLISLYYDLGVRQMLLAYNKDNQASGGCMEGAIGLTAYGQDPRLSGLCGARANARHCCSFATSRPQRRSRTRHLRREFSAGC